MLPRTLEPEVMDTVEEAVDYDQMDHSFVNQLFVDDFLQTLKNLAADNSAGNTSQQPQIVDLGTGTAQIPIQLLKAWPECGPVSACDLSMEMLRLANRNITAAGCDGRIHSVFCDAKQLPFASQSVDICLSNSIIHHIPEPVAVIAEVARCLKPGGLIFFRDLLRPTSAADVNQLVETYAGQEQPHAQKMFRESLHAALTVDEVQRLFQAVGLHNIDVRQTSDRHWTASTTATSC